MKKANRTEFEISVSLFVLLAFASAIMVAQPGKPKRINRAIELLEQGQPVYYTGSHEGTAGSFDQGVKDAQTYADYISYDMEHAPFDIKRLAEYMRGLVQGGPTKSGHRTPSVIVNVPVNGTDEAKFHECERSPSNGVACELWISSGASRILPKSVPKLLHRAQVGDQRSIRRRENPLRG